MPQPPTSAHSEEQVFQPVPTQQDMLELSGEARRARAGRARLLILAIFLLGVIVAGGFGMAMVKQNAETAVQKAEQQITDLNGAIRKKDAQIAEQADQLAALKAETDSFADFQSIVVLRRQSALLEQEIAALLAEPIRAGAPRRLTEIPPDVEWLDKTITALKARRDQLDELKAQIEAWPPAAPSPRPD